MYIDMVQPSWDYMRTWSYIGYLEVASGGLIAFSGLVVCGMYVLYVYNRAT